MQGWEGWSDAQACGPLHRHTSRRTPTPCIPSLYSKIQWAVEDTPVEGDAEVGILAEHRTLCKMRGKRVLVLSSSSPPAPHRVHAFLWTRHAFLRVWRCLCGSPQKKKSCWLVRVCLHFASFAYANAYCINENIDTASCAEGQAQEKRRPKQLWHEKPSEALAFRCVCGGGGGVGGLSFSLLKGKFARLEIWKRQEWLHTQYEAMLSQRRREKKKKEEEKRDSRKQHQ